MRVPMNSFDAQDMDLCRAHSHSVGRDSMYRWILEQQPPEKQPSLTVRAFEVGDHTLADMPLTPASKSPTPPAQPSASAWRRGKDVPVSEQVGLWFVRGLGESAHRTSGRTARSASCYRFNGMGEYRPAAPGTKYGDRYDESRYATADLSARLADACGAALVGAKAAA